MDYHHLTGDQRDTLKAERTLALEADHYRLSLAVAELADDTPTEQREAMCNELGDLERRILLHRGAEPTTGGVEPEPMPHAAALPAPIGEPSA